MNIQSFLSSLNRSPRTIRAYGYALLRFEAIVGADAELTEDTYTKFLKAIKNFSPSTQQQWTTAVRTFYRFHRAGNDSVMKDLSRHYLRRKGKNTQEPNMESVQKVIDYCSTLQGDLAALRDKAFVLTVSDSGLRISEACALLRGDVDWKRKLANIVGKGEKRATVHFSDRAMDAIQQYLAARSAVEPDSRKPLSSQPLFARHDISASKRILPVRSGGMWKSIKSRIKEAGVEKTIRIHDFRHYFVSRLYNATRDMMITKEGARHESIQTTARYTHLDETFGDVYNKVFNDGG